MIHLLQKFGCARFSIMRLAEEAGQFASSPADTFRQERVELPRNADWGEALPNRNVKSFFVARAISHSAVSASTRSGTLKAVLAAEQ
jgi:hypothetical protein